MLCTLCAKTCPDHLRAGQAPALRPTGTTNAPHVWLPAFSCSLCCFCNDGLVVWQRHSLVSALQRRLGKMTATMWPPHSAPHAPDQQPARYKAKDTGALPCHSPTAAHRVQTGVPKHERRTAWANKPRAGSWRASSGSGGGVCGERLALLVLAQLHLQHAPEHLRGEHRRAAAVHCRLRRAQQRRVEVTGEQEHTI